METIGDRLRQFGKENFSNMTEFGRAISMTQASLSVYLNNKREPGTGILLRLENLGCSIDWLLTGKHRITSIINSYPVKKGMLMESETIEEVFYPYHKKNGMYCLLIDELDVIQQQKKINYTLIIVDKDREIGENNEVVVRDKKGNEYYKKIHAADSEKKIFMPVNITGNALVLSTDEIEIMHRVVSKYIRV